ncbi:hypothetical protein SAMD00019534_106140 [Acytostelium subglobosum LB1]|uniref:hypothetical protein n=1 Tax=Acytostelium subglobosum LB1 TaxID=1410327 RepID=UPI000644BBB8|nr:hypothetical protein SAMD00019534_106140 [Acytostelium subglobosum LB1]GAM27438.1 hypothetical protein SAMD00019534_106140 [Acytostelium subglobosum LB1]|eukprot:XP_012749503.1 hypothetical protein SAMD00019534_106140 [Acytostelium subglobosum LB1]
MDSFLTFGLCDQALDFTVECEFPDQSSKQYQFQARHTVDKIRTCILQDCPVEYNRQDYALSIDNEELSVDFSRFIVSNPKITQTLEMEPMVRIKLAPKSLLINPFVQREKIFVGSENRTSMSNLKNTLENSPVVSRLAGGGRSLSPTSDYIAIQQQQQTTSPTNKPLKKSPSMVPLPGTTPKKMLPISVSPPISPESSKDVTSPGKSNGDGEEQKYSPLSSLKNLTISSVPRIKSFIVHSLDKRKTLNPKAHSSSDDLRTPSHLASHSRSRTHENLHANMSLSAPSTPPESVTPPGGEVHPHLQLQLQEAAIEQQVKDYTLVDNMRGFVVEPYRSLTEFDFTLDPLITSESWYTNHFASTEHQNFVGEDDKNGPYIISVLKTSSGDDAGNGGVFNKNAGSYKILLRTKSDDIFTTVNPKASFLMSSNKIPIKEIVMNVSPDLSTKNIRQVKNTDIQKDLTNFEVRQRIKSFKFGVLYCAPNQSMEEEMFSNEHGSEDFNEFLTFLGKRIKLEGWTNYRGGLDVKNNTTGAESVYENYQGFEIMYHIAPMLPYSTVDNQQVEKKRHIGNDIVVLIFKEGDRPFNPNIMQSDFNHVFIVVAVDYENMTIGGPKRYKLSVVYKEGVSASQPALPYPCSFEANQEFIDYLLCKLINSECASYDAPSFRIKIQRTRTALLKDIIGTYGKE